MLAVIWPLFKLVEYQRLYIKMDDDPTIKKYLSSVSIHSIFFVQKVRRSTMLNLEKQTWKTNVCLRYLQKKDYVIGGHARTARVLLTMVIPGHLIFGYTISYLQAGHTSFTLIFLIVYLTAALVQVHIANSNIINIQSI